MTALAREDQRTVARNGMQLAQQLHRLPGQGHQVRITMLLAIDTPLHPRSRHAPKRSVEIDLRPGRRSQFVRALKKHGRQLKRRTHDGSALVAPDDANQRSQLGRQDR